MLTLAPRPSQPPLVAPNGLVSLWDMLHRFYSHHFMALAESIDRLSRLIEAPPEQWNAMLAFSTGQPRRPESEALGYFLKVVKETCSMSGLTHSADLVEFMINDTPRSGRELRILFNSIRKEMERHVYVRIGEVEAKRFEDQSIIDGVIGTKFPRAALELFYAGNAYACGLPEACVFHAMRAAETGVQVLARNLGVTFPHGDITLEQWHTILEQIESKIGALKKQPKSTKKVDDQAFYSQCAAQFRYFKDGFRVRVAHAHENFGDKRALAILNHSVEFFEYLSGRLAEPV